LNLLTFHEKPPLDHINKIVVGQKKPHITEIKKYD